MGDLSNMVIPRHVAIILDGNGRWAKKRGLPRTMGHREGCKTVEKTVEIAVEVVENPNSDTHDPAQDVGQEPEEGADTGTTDTEGTGTTGGTTDTGDTGTTQGAGTGEE